MRGVLIKSSPVSICLLSALKKISMHMWLVPCSTFFCFSGNEIQQILSSILSLNTIYLYGLDQNLNESFLILWKLPSKRIQRDPLGTQIQWSHYSAQNHVINGKNLAMMGCMSQVGSAQMRVLETQIFSLSLHPSSPCLSHSFIKGKNSRCFWNLERVRMSNTWVCT